MSKSFGLAIAAVTLAMLFSGPGPASAWPVVPGTFGQSPTLRLGSQSGVPSGYFELCSKRPGLCRTRMARGMKTTKGGAAVATASRMAQLEGVNRRVNRSIRPVADRARGAADRWTVGGTSGDCEDYALTKRQLLLRRGWPSSALLLAQVRTPRGEQHVVLVARTDRGDLVLDNRTSQIKSWSLTGYRWDMIQSPTQMWVWHQVR